MRARQLPAGGNAAAAYAEALDRGSLARIARAIGVAGGERVAGALAGDLARLLNLCTRAELDALAAAFRCDDDGDIGALRARLWLRGAEAEARGPEHLGSPVQPVPVVLRGKLVHLAALPGREPPAPAWPRPVPPAVCAPAFDDEPESIDELLDRATAIVGVRLGAAARDKGAYGARIAALLGVVERGHREPDWRGEVELKSVPVVRDASGGWWRVKEDPAISMVDAEPWAKLQRVLWIARVADEPDAPVLSWFYQERDAVVAALMRRDLHTRPKGGAGATTRGWYLHKRFFVDGGLLRSLNLEVRA